MKERVTTAPVLKHFDRTKEAILETDSSDYVNGGVLSQYGDDGILYPVAFYSKNMAPAECNYEIYDKELLAIIRCLEHWRPELESTDIPIKIFTDHKNLEYFMTTKELTRRQARWAEKLAEFNFKILYQSGAKNHKADALTRMPGYRPDNDEDDRKKYQHQVLLTPDRLLAEAIGEDPEEFLPSLIKAANQADSEGKEIRKAFTEALPRVDTREFATQDDLLLHQQKLWVPDQDCLRTRLIREVHDQPSSGHQGEARTLEAIRRSYSWPELRKDVEQYIRNCHTCKRSKAPRDRQNGLLQPLPIPEQRWKDISMDFITGLPLSTEGFNTILTVVDRLSKERHYIPCTAGDEGTSAEETAKLFLRWVYRTHGLPDSIVSDRGTQFVSLMWKSLCTRLGITSKLSTAYHPQTDGQTERANQDMERYLRSYCNYMQDDWSTWLSMAEFADNNAQSSATQMTPFFLNKGFHPRMSFDTDPTKPTTSRERLQIERAKDIAAHMETALETAKRALQDAREAMIKSANKKRKEVVYSPGDLVFLSSRNIKTTRPSKKLDDKMLGPFKVLKAVGASYRLQLPTTMRIHDVFHPSLLRKAAEDPLPGQINEPPQPVVVDDEDEWEVDDILDSRLFGKGKRLQYKVRWKGLDQDLEWYNADGGEFDNCQDLVEDFHRRYPIKPRYPTKLKKARKARI
jgi:transposase InsO family protein